jgi:FlaA1/EpsC-like NDP-sugar epimerase
MRGAGCAPYCQFSMDARRVFLPTDDTPPPTRDPSKLPSVVVSRLRRDVPLALLDMAIVAGAYLTAIVLRFEGAVPDRYWGGLWRFLPVLIVFHVAANAGFGLYGQMWKYASIQEARKLVLAWGCSVALVLTLGIALPAPRPIPLSVLVFGSVFAAVGLGAIRFQSRLFAFRRATVGGPRSRASRALLMGAGEAAAMILTDVRQNPSTQLDLVGFVDDDPRKKGLRIRGVPVLGSRDDIPSLVDQLAIDEVLLAIPSATSDLVRGVAALCEEVDVPLRVLPSVREIVGGRVRVHDLRDLGIEDLLGRQQVQTDLAAVRGMLHDRRVLITGAGGSIGSEIARQVASLEPETLILLDHDETHLHDLVTGLTGSVKLEVVLADIRDRYRTVETFFRYRPEVVFHAAALKHVPVLELHPREAVATNVLGTAHVVDAAVAAGVERFVLVSTDKAVRPSSVMGASKRLAEEIVRSFQEADTVMCAVRFGNVLGSRGSVIPTFLQQIAAGGPVTITDPAMTRYFMSVREAVQLVLQAGALSEGGEVFTLEMGQQVNILSLARRLIRLSGKVPDEDIELRIVGPRPGEKLAEELRDPDEEAVPTGHDGIVVSQPPVLERADLRASLQDLERLVNDGADEELASFMKAWSQPRTTVRTAELSEVG